MGSWCRKMASSFINAVQCPYIPVDESDGAAAVFTFFLPERSDRCTALGTDGCSCTLVASECIRILNIDQFAVVAGLNGLPLKTSAALLIFFGAGDILQGRLEGDGTGPVGFSVVADLRAMKTDG